MNRAYILTLSCPDRPGIVHAVSGFLLERGGNIEEAAQYNDHDTGLFFMRVQFACDQLTFEDLKVQLGFFAEPFEMAWKLHATHRADAHRDHGQQGRPLPERPAVSLEERPAARWRSRAIVSNHRDFYQLAASYNVPFHHIPVTAADQGPGRGPAIRDRRVARARSWWCWRATCRSCRTTCAASSRAARSTSTTRFLPSFKGAKPYYQAHDRGVKLIGATAHYVTADLDEGPIIEQDVARVDHSATVEDLTAQGRDTESQVLARAVKWHSEHRVLINGHKTVIFK